MIKQILKSKVLAVGVLISAFIVFYSSDAFARGGHENHGHYYYNGGNWNRSWWFWGSFATGFAIGTIITKLPPYYETIYVSGVPYYYYDNVYYRSYPNGYIIVPAPTTTTAVAVPVIIQPQEISNATAVINVPNARGGYTPVTLTRHKTGYIGPQGEYYEDHPTVEQLRILYGK